MTKSTTIPLFSGGEFDLAEPAASTFTVSDIAHSLAHICRFTGHPERHYSVAEHSVLCSYLVPERLAFQALVHDAAEAFIGDVSSPLKAMLPDYRRIEARVEAAVFGRLEVLYPFDPPIKIADRQMLALEKVIAMGRCERWDNSSVQPAPVQLRFWEPMLARQMFLLRFYELRSVESLLLDAGPLGVPQPHVSTRCADCHQVILADGSGHVSWCPFAGMVECPRLDRPHPLAGILEGRGS